MFPDRHASTPASGAAPASPSDIVVSGVGMVSPVGAGAEQTFTSVRAGICRMRELPEIYVCLPENDAVDEPDPLVGSAVYHLADDARRAGRMAEWLAFLAAQAYRDLLHRARLEDADPSRLAVFLSVPAAVEPRSCEEIIHHFHDFAGLDLLRHVELVFGDRASPLALAEKAAASLREQRIGLAAVGGVDSYFFQNRLAALDRDWRIQSSRNPDGFRPGEAAAFLLLERRRDAERRGVPPLAVLDGFASGAFQADRGLPNTGAELAAVLDRLRMSGAAPLVFCDLNGESTRAKEWSYAVSRLGQRFQNHRLEHPASILGDLGAATGAVLAALAVQYLGARRMDRTHAIVWAGSDDGERRAMLLQRSRE